MSKRTSSRSNCCNASVLFDAYSVWSEEKQEMILYSTMDCQVVYCEKCYEPCDIVETQIKEG